MADETDARDVALPRKRAFVLQLSPARAGADPFRGRIEHLASGQVAHFASLERLREFVEEVLAPSSEEPRPDVAAQGRDDS